MATVLLIHESQEERRRIAAILQDDHHEVWEHSTEEDARRRVSLQKHDVVLVTHRLASADLLVAARESDPAVSVIVWFAAGQRETRDDAFDFLSDPVHPDLARAAVRRASERTQLLRENQLLRRVLSRLQDTLPAMEAAQSDIPSEGGNVPEPVLPESFDLTAILEQKEKNMIERMLSHTGGAQAEAARRLGLSRSSLAYKLSKYGIRTVPPRTE